MIVLIVYLFAAVYDIMQLMRQNNRTRGLPLINFSFKDKAARRGLLTIIKFVFAVALTVLAYLTAKEPAYLLVGLIELALIFVIYNLLVDTKIVFRLLADLLFFIYVAQMLVLYFGNSFITLTMLKILKNSPFYARFFVTLHDKNIRNSGASKLTLSAALRA